MKKYYSLEPIKSRGAAFNFVIGHRSAGKTYAWKQDAIEAWIRNKSEWVYVRRISDELDSCKHSLWDDIAYKYGYETKVRGYKCLIRPIFIEDVYLDDKGKERLTQPEPWEPFGYYIPVSEQQNYKSSVLPKVTTICFDEFIIENRRRQYIQDEVNQYNSLVFSIFRDRKFRSYCLSNAGYISNPYFQYYNIKSTDFQNTSFVKRNGNEVLFEFYRPDDVEEIVENSLIAKVSNKDYIDYALRSKFMDASQDLVSDKPGGSAPMIKLTTDGETWYTVYKTPHSNSYWIDRKDSGASGFAVHDSLVTGDTIYSKDIINTMKHFINNRLVHFASADVRAVFLGIFGMS